MPAARCSSTESARSPLQLLCPSTRSARFLYLLPGGNRRRQTDSRFARKAKANTFCICLGRQTPTAHRRILHMRPTAADPNSHSNASLARPTATNALCVVVRGVAYRYTRPPRRGLWRGLTLHATLGDLRAGGAMTHLRLTTTTRTRTVI